MNDKYYFLFFFASLIIYGIHYLYFAHTTVRRLERELKAGGIDAFPWDGWGLRNGLCALVIAFSDHPRYVAQLAWAHGPALVQHSRPSDRRAARVHLVLGAIFLGSGVIGGIMVH